MHGVFIEGGIDDFRIGNAAFEFCHFLGPFVDEEHDEMHVGPHTGARDGDLFQERRLARLGGRDDECALTFSDGREQIDDAQGKLALLFGERDPLFGITGSERFILRTGLAFSERDAVDAQKLLKGRGFVF